jgi:hypothetical protein
MIDTFTLYKKLLAAGIPELQAKAIQKAAFKYIESISTVREKEYDILLNSLINSGLTIDQAELISDLIKSQSHYN